MNLFQRAATFLVTKKFTAPQNTALGNTRIVNQTAPTLAGQLILAMPTAPVTKTVTVALTAAEVLSGLLLANQGGGAAATYTMPTGTLLQAEILKTNPEFKVGDTFDLSIVNISVNALEIVTVAGDTGTTAVGNMTIAANGATTSQAWGTFRFRRTGANAFSFYRIG